MISVQELKILCLEINFLSLGGRRRRHPRHGLGGPRHYSSWAVDYALDRIELSPANGVWKLVDDKMPPVRSTF